MRLAIAHTENKTQVLDAIRERKSPFSPEGVVIAIAVAGALVTAYKEPRASDFRQPIVFPKDWVAV